MTNSEFSNRSLTNTSSLSPVPVGSSRGASQSSLNEILEHARKLHGQGVEATEEHQSEVRAALAVIPELIALVKQVQGNSFASKEDRDAENTENGATHRVVNHELRNRLAPALSYLGILQRSLDRPQEESVHLLGLIKSAVSSAADVLEDLSLLSEDGPDSREELPLTQVIEGVMQSFVSQAEEKGISLQFDGSPNEVLIDGGRLRLVLDNLVKNALDYHDKESRPRQGHQDGQVGRDGRNGRGRTGWPGEPLAWVKVAYIREANWARVDVEDNGPGIPEALRERVFEENERGVQPPSPGHGLGLTVAARAMRSLGGHIELASGTAGGTKVSVYWPAESRCCEQQG